MVFSCDGGEDENGNPQATGYESSGYGRQQSKFPSNPAQLTEFIPGDKDNGEEAMSSSGASQQTKKSRKRKDQGIKAESIPGYVGDKPLDEVLCFIDGRNNHVPGSSSHKTAQHPSAVNSNRTDHSKASVAMATQNSVSTIHGQQDQWSHGTQTKTETKTKRKKKNKSGTGIGTKSSLEMEENTSHGSEGECDGVKEKGAEDSTSSDLLEGGTSVSSTKASSLTGEEAAISPDNPFDSTDESYIFTDMPVIQKEEQFTVVNKSKKKKKNFLSSRDLPPRDVTNVHKEEVSSWKRSRPQTRSFTPPPSTSTSSKQERSSERALSPSSFPVLGNPREARRNSTGNLAELERSYDSDHESVKSVPPSALADGNKSGMDILPPSYKPPPVSYATIAAGKRSLLQNSGASIQDGDKPPPDSNKLTDKPAKSINSVISQTEPEHSEIQLAAIAEQPKSACGDSRPSSASHSICAKVKLSQSIDTAQSTPNSTTSSDSAVTACVSSANVCCSSVVSETASSVDSTTECHGEVGDQGTEHSGVESTSKDVELNVNNAVDFPALPQINTVTQLGQVSGKESTCSTTTLSSQMQQAVIIPSCKMNLTKSASTTGVEPKSVASKPPTVPIRNTSLKSKSKSSTKSVIFMDGRMDEQPINLDISFGFEPGFDNSIVLPVRIDSGSTCSSDSGRDTDSDSATIHLMLNKDNDHSIAESISLSVQHGSVADVATVVTTTSSGSDNNVQHLDIRSKLQKMRRHGQLVFIGPEQPDINVSTSNETCHVKLGGTPNGIISPLAQCIQPSLSNSTVVTENHIILGDTNKPHEDTHAEMRTVALSETKDKSKNCVFSYDRANDPNFQSGSFNHEAGVAFLYTG